ncbi:sensor histidine kinase [Paenibacillus sp. GYB003]|uniref:sensor histidine kinase n=1 Tax=Paenibacillus sp. GYB003 TaxID=2994392 RepID=UPI002F96B493
MFNKLRNKLLVLNLSITSGVLAAAFAFVYFITYSGVQSEIRSRLGSQPETQIRLESGAPGVGEQGERSVTRTTSGYAAGDGANVFHIEVDADGNMLNVDSLVDLPDEAYRLAAESAWRNKDGRHAIALNGRQWRYGIAPIQVQIVREDGVPVVVDENKYSITFLDVTETNRTLVQLLTSLLLVGFATLIVIVIVSLYFANRAIKPIREAWDKQKQFVTDASHELKTPLSIIHANCDALEANRDDTIRNQMKWLGYIRIGTDRMAKLVNDMLTLAKTEDARSIVRKVPVHVSKEVEDAIRSMEAAAALKRIRLTRSIEPNIVANGEPDCIRQIVAILFDNAIKYADSEGWIEMSLVRKNRHVTFTISNSGPGIAGQDVPKVFDRFFRADRSRTHADGSYGLGLSIAKSIVDRLGGEIRVSSIENEFTTFSFTIEL